jgi:hypothetical protein
MSNSLDINTIHSVGKNMNNKFINDYINNIYNLLGFRKDSFLYIFIYLIKKNKKFYNIIETGCTRKITDFDDGMSSILFDRFINYYDGKLTTIDISKENCELCKKHVSHKTTIINMDSVKYLWNYYDINNIDLIYLDSYDLDWNKPHKSSLHHLKELCAIIPKLKKGCVIMIDDNNNGVGKGQYVSDFLENIGATLLFSNYQIAYEL